MTKPQSNPDDDPDPYRPPADPLRPDRWHCPCGATADQRREVCRKCRDRARFAHRTTAGRRASRRPADTRPPRRHRPALSVDPRGDHHR